MADVKKIAPNPAPAGSRPESAEERLTGNIELIFFAYRDFISEPDAILAAYDFGRAHHRVIHFVGRNPAISVADLLGILRITKQSLARVLRELVEQGFVEQRTGTRDRRQRLLHLTDKGLELERQLSAPQRERVSRALKAAGPGAEEVWRSVMLDLVNEDDRARVEQMITKSRND